MSIRGAWKPQHRRLGVGPSRSTVLIKDVVVPKGRRPLGDIKDLVSSIKDVGLINPITLTPDLRLVAGLHRLEACRALGWVEIPAIVLPLEKIQANLVELDENLARRELTVLERGELLVQRKALYEALHPETRRGTAGGRAKAARRNGAPTNEIPSFAGAVARTTHLSPRTIQHEVAIVHAIPGDVRKKLRGTRLEDRKVDLMRLARLPHEEQRALVDIMSRGTVPTLRAAQAQLTRSAIESHTEPLPEGPFSVVVVDPPWPHDDHKRPYPSMSLGEIMSLQVGKLAAKNAVVLLWVPPTMLRDGVEALEGWGFKQVGLVAWDKKNARPGVYVRSQVELCLVGVRGNPRVLSASSNLIMAARREHSRKPDEFYAWVERSFGGPRVDLFARESRKGWATWGAEKTRFDAERAEFGMEVRSLEDTRVDRTSVWRIA